MRRSSRQQFAGGTTGAPLTSAFATAAATATTRLLRRRKLFYRESTAKSFRRSSSNGGYAPQRAIITAVTVNTTSTATGCPATGRPATGRPATARTNATTGYPGSTADLGQFYTCIAWTARRTVTSAAADGRSEADHAIISSPSTAGTVTPPVAFDTSFPSTTLHNAIAIVVQPVGGYVFT